MDYKILSDMSIDIDLAAAEQDGIEFIPMPYDLGEQEYHLAFKAEDFDAAHAKHEAMGCICFENPSMGIYFLEDPDGYWIEIIPDRTKRT